MAVICTFENGGKAALRHAVTHMIVEKDNTILMVKRAEHLLEGGKWSVPSGYMEMDETAAEGALRELYEETGWEGKIIELFSIITNPHRPNEDRQNIAFEFVVEPIKKSGTPDQESTAVEWIPIEKIRFDELAFDHGESLRLYLEWKKKKFHLPLFR